ncbi:MAG: thiamine-phosphate kinase [Saprospiraceae bacterium]|jgi:thiamine-monophosphate kinase
MEKRTDLGQLGEFGLIDHLTSSFIFHHKSTHKGVGDDAAVIDLGNDQGLLVSTDMLIEGIHFDLIYTPLKHLGYKSVVVNLSDIYAMNGIPSQITASIAISNRFSLEAVDELYAGIKAACDFYQVDLIGGDTSSTNKGMMISITALGYGKLSQLVYRNGAEIGDLICVSGSLGSAYLGLQLLEREKQLFLDNPEMQPDLEGQNYVVGRQLKPEARRDVIQLLNKNQIIPSSMIDVSDGIASELFHICQQSKVGAFIEEEAVPINQEAQLLAIKFNLDPITCALNGGEDYELLFTVNPKDLEKIRFLPDINIIGEIVPPEDGIKLHTKGGNIHNIKAQGWQHFNPNK